MNNIERAPAYPAVRDSSGKYKMADEDKLLQMDIEQVIKTPIGSRPMWKGIGCKIDKLLFSIDIEDKSALATKFVKDAVSGIVTGCEIIEVNIKQDEEIKTMYYIEIKYRRTNERFIKSFTLPYNLR